MASISTDKNGNRRILISGLLGPGTRHAIHIGKATKKQAERLRALVETLVNARRTGAALDDQVIRSVNSLLPSIRKRLVALGLIDDAGQSGPRTLGRFVNGFVAGRTNIKPATKEVWRQGEVSLLDFFGEDRLMTTVTPGDADDYLEHLKGLTSRIKKPLAPMTIQKRLRFAKAIFRAAHRKKLIQENPFEDVNFTTSKPERGFFVTPEMTARLLAACPDHHWRMIVLLCRIGGLRCPSEVLSLRWQDIDWGAERIVVHSPKTEHHPGKDKRVIPLFPELRNQLRECFEMAKDGDIYVIDSRYRRAAIGPSGWRNVNLRTRFRHIIAAAGLQEWPRLFHNLRSSRQTELVERFPSHVVCGWLGNSEEIAKAHYYQITDAHFTQATAQSGSITAAPPNQRPGNSAAANEPERPDDEPPNADGRPSDGNTPPPDYPSPKGRGGQSAESDAREAQNPTQRTAAHTSTEQQQKHSTPITATTYAAACRSVPQPAKPQNGRGGIRTHEPLSRLPVFKTGAFDHSATRPGDGRGGSPCGLR